MTEEVESNRDQLLGDVWGYSSEVTTRTVDTHIKDSRKIRSVGDYIQTIRGVGYRFSEIQISINEHKRKDIFYCNVLFMLGLLFAFIVAERDLGASLQDQIQIELQNKAKSFNHLWVRCLNTTI